MRILNTVQMKPWTSEEQFLRTQVLAEFWWANVVPAKHEIAAEAAAAAATGLGAGLELAGAAVAAAPQPSLDLKVAIAAAASHRPASAHRLTRRLIADSKAMAAAAPATVFPQ